MGRVPDKRLFQRIWAAAMLLVWVAAGWGAGAVRAQEGIEVLAAPPPEYEFGRTMTFQLLARGEAEITSVRLVLQPAGDSPIEWSEVEFEPGTNVAAAATLDLALYPLPPFSAIDFWWELADAEGGEFSTPPQTFQYTDNRFAWQQLSDGSLTAHWYDGDVAFGEAVLSTASGALPRINRDIRAPLAPHTDVIVYGSAAEVQAALQRLGQVWTDGHADPALGVVLVVVPNDLRADFAMQREVPHELTHVLLYQALGDNLRFLPQWLNEGLAVMNQGQPDDDFAALLAAARTSDSFLDLASLCGRFPADGALFRLAYAQSESVVRYVRERFGSEGVYALLTAYGSGADCNGGVQAALGLSLEELQAAWLREAIYGGTAGSEWAGAGPWVLLAGLVLLAPVGFLIFGRRRVL
jgi:hypothetical protein